MEIRQSLLWVKILITRVMISNKKSRSNSNQKRLKAHQKNKSINRRIRNNTNSQDGMMGFLSRLPNASLTSKMITSRRTILHNR